MSEYVWSCPKYSERLTSIYFLTPLTRLCLKLSEICASRSNLEGFVKYKKVNNSKRFQAVDFAVSPIIYNASDTSTNCFHTEKDGNVFSPLGYNDRVSKGIVKERQ
jgi:hypothetical protein